MRPSTGSGEAKSEVGKGKWGVGMGNSEIRMWKRECGKGFGITQPGV